MAQNEIDDVYGTQGQVEFARKMAESLLKGAGTGMPSADMAVLPGTWAYGAGNLLRALAGNQYRGIAGSQEAAIRDRGTDPSAPNPMKNLRNSQIKNQTRFTPPPRHDYGGGNPDAVGGDVAGDAYKNEVKKSENEPLFSGKKTRDRAVWDHKQHSIGFGTRAKPGEEIDVAEAHKRFDTEWAKAQDEVDGFKPGLPIGVRSALTSLTYNAGSQWMREKLGAAIQKGDKEAARKYFLAYHNASGKPEPGLIARRQREVKWFDDLGDQDPTKQAEPLLKSDKMSLGGPKPEGELQPTNQPLGDQYAQANPFPAQPVAPGTRVQQLPPAPPISSPEQLKWQRRGADTGQGAQEILEKHLDRGKGREFETTIGKGTVVPDPMGGPPQVSHTPSKGFPIHTGKFSGTVLPNQQGGFDLTIPGQPGKSFGSLNEIFQYMRQQEAMDTASQKITEGQSSEITEAISQGNKAPQLIKSLNTLDTLSKSGDVPRGPLSKYSVAVRQVLDNLGLTKYIPDIASADLTKAETIQKINAELARQAVNSFTNRGTNFELETYIQNNPGILQSKEGMEMLIDVIRQEYKGIQEIGKLANSTQPGDIAAFQGKIADYYEKNPIIITGPIVDPKTKKVIDPRGKLTTRNIQGEEDIAKVPSGQYFMLPSGRMGKKP